MNQEFSVHINSFIQKLDSVNVDEISINPYIKDYLQTVLQQKNYYTKIYAFVLQNTLIKSNKSINEITLLDFGCGNGLLAMFAKHCGIETVYGCDFNPDFVEAAKALSQAININVNGWFVSNEDELFNTSNDLKLDVIIGTDVIEHIYNLNVFFKNIFLINAEIITGFTTASVYDNFLKKRSLYKLMKQDETISSNAFHATFKDEYVGMAYVETRKKLIGKDFPQLQKKTIFRLAKATRGLRKEDIKKFVEKYLANQNVEIEDVLKTNKFNTCDPITGNFTERILKLEEYKTLYRQNNFSLKVISGFYNAEGKSIKARVQNILNIFTCFFKNCFISRTVTPFILLIGAPNKK